jgi:hypothetical protein
MCPGQSRCHEFRNSFRRVTKIGVHNDYHGTFCRLRTTRRGSILQRAQLRVMGMPFSCARSFIDRIASFCSRLIQVPFIGPTNPHSFFFLRSPTLPTDQRGHAPFAQAPASVRHSQPERRFSSWRPAEICQALKGALPSLLTDADQIGGLDALSRQGLCYRGFPSVGFKE